MTKTKEKTKEEMQKICYDLAKKHGNAFIMRLAEYLKDEERFDPDEDCDIWSCEVCGLCGSYDEGLEQTKIKTTYAGDEDEGDRPEYLWNIECDLCGAHYKKEGPEAEM